MQETQEMQIWSLSLEDPLEEGTAAHSSILARRIPWTEEPGGLQSTALQKVRHGWSNPDAYTHTHTHTHTHIRIHLSNKEFSRRSTGLNLHQSSQQFLQGSYCPLHPIYRCEIRELTRLYGCLPQITQWASKHSTDHPQEKLWTW